MGVCSCTIFLGFYYLPFAFQNDIAALFMLIPAYQPTLSPEHTFKNDSLFFGRCKMIPHVDHLFATNRGAFSE